MGTGLGFLLLILTTHLFILIAPYTKVEETLNVHATHDILYHGWNIDRYDHFEFPGVVPRTLLGSLAISLVSSPFVLLSRILGLPKIASLLIVRCFTAWLSLASLSVLRGAITKRFGDPVASLFLILTAIQFHLPFYASRLLPNTIASIISNVALATIIEDGAIRHPKRPLILLTAATVIFRCDLSLLLGAVGIYLLVSKRIRFWEAAFACLVTGLVSLLLTVSVDSLFWKRLAWPEGEVFWFNTYLNKSKDWGTEPWGWYFFSALPRAIQAGCILAPLGVAFDRRLQPILAIAVGYTLLYSNLAHKELRFLFPVLPLFNLCSSVAVYRLYINRKKSLWRRLAYVAACALLGVGVCFTVMAAYVSSMNYPGGVALVRAQQLELVGSPTYVHSDVVPAITGVSKYLERGGGDWVLSREENLTDDMLYEKFDYLISDRDSVRGFKKVGDVQGYAGMQCVGGSLKTAVLAAMGGRVPVVVKKEPLVYILRRIQ